MGLNSVGVEFCGVGFRGDEFHGDEFRGGWISGDEFRGLDSVGVELHLNCAGGCGFQDMRQQKRAGHDCDCLL